MKITFKLFVAFVVVLQIMAVTGCEKAPEDYRMKYTGNYVFTSIAINWVSGQQSKFDTLVYNGNINLYSDGDDANTLCQSYDSSEINYRRITIEFLTDVRVSPEILKDSAELKKIDGYHCSFSGRFLTDKSLEFRVSYGGLGGGTIFTVKGIKK
jgi:hypothetical protein